MLEKLSLLLPSVKSCIRENSEKYRRYSIFKRTKIKAKTILFPDTSRLELLSVGRVEERTLGRICPYIFLKELFPPN